MYVDLPTHCRSRNKIAPIYDQLKLDLLARPDMWVRRTLADTPGSTLKNKQSQMLAYMKVRGLVVDTRSDATYLYIRIRPEVSL